MKREGGPAGGHITRSSAQACRRPVKNSLYSPAVGSWIVFGSNAVFMACNKGTDVRVRVADAADLEVVAVHVEDVQPVAADVNLAQGPQLPAGALEELQGQVQVAV